MKNLFKIIIILCCITGNLKAQQTNELTKKLESYAKSFPVEKIYLSLDKPYYNIGDTLWFKGFLLDYDFTASKRADKMYVELYNDSLLMVEYRVIPLNNGLGYGDFALKKPLKEGIYTLRAYSNWQQNFGTDYFYQKTFYIGNAEEQSWLLNSYQKIITEGTNKKLDLKIKITDLKNNPIGLKDLEIYLMKDKKRIMRAELQTTADGRIETIIPLSSTKLNGKYSFYIIDKKNKNQRSVLPISLQDMDEVDLQFMPEGGNMVNGLYGKVAFKAIGVDGLGKKIDGKIVDSKNVVISSFSAMHKGMGNFFLLPQKEETYTAVYMLNGKETRRSLPKAREEGTSLRIDHLSKPDSMLVYLRATPSKRISGYHLVAQASGDILLNVPINLSNGFFTIKLPKKDFPDGIIHFTLVSPENRAVNERQAFIKRQQKINLKILPHKQSYGLRDSTSIEITATKEDGSPLSGTFSLAVTDDAQVKQTDESNIITHFLLQADLKGDIEAPSWYLEKDDASTALALDQLLLTQGWIGYDWSKLETANFNPSFKAEKGSDLEGKVIGLFKKPIEGITVNLLSLGKQIMLIDTLTDANGKFVFKNLPLLDTAAYIIKIKNAKGKTATGNISVDEFELNKTAPNFGQITPWYVNADSTTLNYFKTTQNNVISKQKEQTAISGTQLKEVEIKAKTRLNEIITNNAWDAKFMLSINEEELKKMPQKVLFDLLKEKIPELRIGYGWTDRCAGRFVQHDFQNFLIGSSLISHVLIDKINTNLAASGAVDNYQETGISITAKKDTALLVYPANSYIFNTLSASEIKNISLYKGCNYYFLDITTRSGKGPFIAPTPGRYIYRPLPLYFPKEFYSPKYTVSKSSQNADLRSTIFWDANVVTDENGKASIWFYTADKPGSYTIKMEGTDLFGRFGFKKDTIKVVNNAGSK
jgi:5-hydroxyisourate hydrolase-like protein (transthyretin family)